MLLVTSAADTTKIKHNFKILITPPLKPVQFVATLKEDTY
jgi:hypothetical protein